MSVKLTIAEALALQKWAAQNDVVLVSGLPQAVEDSISLTFSTDLSADELKAIRLFVTTRTTGDTFTSWQVVEAASISPQHNSVKRIVTNYLNKAADTLGIVPAGTSMGAPLYRKVRQLRHG